MVGYSPVSAFALKNQLAIANWSAFVFTLRRSFDAARAARRPCAYSSSGSLFQRSADLCPPLRPIVASTFHPAEDCATRSISGSNELVAPFLRITRERFQPRWLKTTSKQSNQLFTTRRPDTHFPLTPYIQTKRRNRRSLTTCGFTSSGDAGI